MQITTPSISSPSTTPVPRCLKRSPRRAASTATAMWPFPAPRRNPHDVPPMAGEGSARPPIHLIPKGETLPCPLSRSPPTSALAQKSAGKPTTSPPAASARPTPCASPSATTACSTASATPPLSSRRGHAPRGSQAALLRIREAPLVPRGRPRNLLRLHSRRGRAPQS